MDGQGHACTLREEQKFLSRIVNDFKPANGDFKPTPEMMSTAQQIRHIADTLDWFREGGWGSGFEMDFEKMEARNREPVTLDQAKGELDAAFARFINLIEPMPAEEFQSPLKENPILGEAPKVVVLNAVTDHTAHHRGALAVYLRLVGVTPKMIYMDS